jgi:hypothetical protein
VADLHAQVLALVEEVEQDMAAKTAINRGALEAECAAEGLLDRAITLLVPVVVDEEEEEAGGKYEGARFLFVRINDHRKWTQLFLFTILHSILVVPLLSA